MNPDSREEYEDDFSLESNRVKEDENPRIALHLDESQACEVSKRLVDQGEKYIKLAQDLNKSKDEIQRLEKELDHFREVLVKDLCQLKQDKDESFTNALGKYSNIPLETLFRLRLQYLDPDNGALQATTNSEKFLLEDELNNSHKRTRQLKEKYAELQKKYDDVLTDKAEVEKLQKKIIHLVERSRYEREIRNKAESEVHLNKTKLEALSDHIERLMVYLKHEATAKVRIVKDRIRARREVELLRARDEVLTKKVTCKDRLIDDLKNSMNILENQLHLMDEKYMELRLKLDWSRSYSERVLKRRDEEIHNLNDEITLLNDKIPKAKTVR